VSFGRWVWRRRRESIGLTTLLMAHAAKRARWREKVSRGAAPHALRIHKQRVAVGAQPLAAICFWELHWIDQVCAVVLRRIDSRTDLIGVHMIRRVLAQDRTRFVNRSM
jgi:hypothetical protein